MTDPFIQFANDISKEFETLAETHVPVTIPAITGEMVWDAYLADIPAEHNRIFRERRYHDGSADKHFVRNAGHVFFIEPGTHKVTTIWNIEGDSYLHKVAHGLHISMMQAFEIDASLPVAHVFQLPVLGSPPNVDRLDTSITWHHFHARIHSIANTTDGNRVQGETNTAMQVLQRAIGDEYYDALQVVQELVNEGQLYRGDTYKGMIQEWIDCIELKRQLPPSKHRIMVAELVHGNPARFHFMSSAIGALVKQIAEGKELEQAVASFESMVAPENYKRSSAVVTTAMFKRARAEIDALGIREALERTGATVVDIEDNAPILHQAHEAPALDVLDEIEDEVALALDAREITSAAHASVTELESLISGASKVEIAVISSMTSNRVAFTKPAIEGAPEILGHSNEFGWSYLNSATTDAIRERVAKAGGKVDAPLRISLAWQNGDDLDLHTTTKAGHVYFSNKSLRGAKLDVDMNAGGIDNDVDPVENIVYPSEDPLFEKQRLRVEVDNYHKRFSQDQGWTLQVATEHYGTLEITGKRNTTTVMDVWVEDGALMVDLVRGATSSEVAIGEAIPSGQWAPVKLIVNSPNYWGSDEFGLRHMVFLTEDYEIDKPTRWLYTELLTPTLRNHRKAFELLGSRLTIPAEKMQDAARGYGFSLTSGQTVPLRITAHNGRRVVVVATF